MTISGLQKTTLIDYPDKIACTVFTHGCNFRCSFCHNPELVVKPPDETIPEEEFFEFLKNRRYLLEGVVVTGGEPCINENLIDFAKKIKGKGFKVKIDTNGSFPKTIQKLLEEKIVDYIAMDIKSTLEDYEEDEYVRYSWVDGEDGEFFEFHISKSEISNDTVLTITDFAEPDDIEDQEQLWESQIENLSQRIGA